MVGGRPDKLKHLMADLLLLLLMVSHLTLCPSSAIPLGSTLYASRLNQSWPSPNSTFYVGFIQVSQGTYLAAVTLSDVGVPIWSAGKVDSSGSFSLLSSGSLRLVNGSGATIWDSGTARLSVSSASIEDSGELVLHNSHSGRVWSSFDHPNDTIVPNQNFTSGKILRSGSYSFELQRNGNLTLKWNDTIVYWNQGLNPSLNANLSSPSMVLQPVGILAIYDSTLPAEDKAVYSSDYGEGNQPFRFLRLDGDGNLRIYSIYSDRKTVTSRWSAVTDQCQVFGYCGNFGICSYKNSNPVCGCPSQNFEPIDADDPGKGCKRKTELENCPGGETMLDLNHTVFLTFPPESTSQGERVVIGVSGCKSNCLSGGACHASVLMSDGSGVCYLKQSEFLSGYQSPSLPSTSFLKVCGPVLPNPSFSENKHQKSHIIIIGIVLIAGLSSLVALEGGALWWFCCRSNPNIGDFSSRYTLLDYASGAPVQFSYKELQRCTQGFKEKLGAGGFGSVYRGVIHNQTVVAVKQLEGVEQGEKQFRGEVATISSTHHLNLVRLIGFCSEGRHRLLVYEFLKNGSLDHLLFRREDHLGKFLSWAYRFTIAHGAARGLTYLHEECRDCIVHCDIKPENILLDESYNAKVSDFGLAKLVKPRDNRGGTLTSIRGTRGYLAPEWLANLPITSKSDVYSFGMVLLEVVSGTRNFEVSVETSQKKFSVWAYEEFDKGNIQAILDKRLEGDSSVDMDQVARVIQVSFWCIQEQPSQRPNMGKVVQMLEGVIEIERPPALKAVAGGSTTWSSFNVSNLSTLVASAPFPSSSSSASRRNIEGTSSLLQSEPD